jgi:hypothetical protein
MAPLITPTGYFSVTPGSQAHGDLQSTYTAISLGMPLSAAARQSLATGHTARGWLAAVSVPDIPSTYRALVTLHACAATLPHPATLTQAISAMAHTFQQAHTSMSGGTTFSPDDILTAARLCWMIKDVGSTRDDTSAARSAFVSAAASSVAANPASSMAALAATTAALDQCGVSNSNEMRAAILRLADRQGVVTIEDAMNAHTIARVFADAGLQAKAAAVATRLAAPSDEYRYRSTAAFADLVSTSYGHLVARTGADARLRALSNYTTAAGPSLAPVGASKDAPVVDIVSFAAAATLVSGDDTGCL